LEEEEGIEEIWLRRTRMRLGLTRMGNLVVLMRTGKKKEEKNFVVLLSSVMKTKKEKNYLLEQAS